MYRSKKRRFISKKMLFYKRINSFRIMCKNIAEKVGISLFILYSIFTTFLVGAMLFSALFLLPAFFH